MIEEVYSMYKESNSWLVRNCKEPMLSIIHDTNQQDSYEHSSNNPTHLQSL
jgi:hypothetical protein